MRKNPHNIQHSENELLVKCWRAKKYKMHACLKEIVEYIAKGSQTTKAMHKFINALWKKYGISLVDKCYDELDITLDQDVRDMKKRRRQDDVS